MQAIMFTLNTDICQLTSIKVSTEAVGKHLRSENQKSAVKQTLIRDLSIIHSLIPYIRSRCFLLILRMHTHTLKHSHKARVLAMWT